MNMRWVLKIRGRLGSICACLVLFAGLSHGHAADFRGPAPREDLAARVAADFLARTNGSPRLFSSFVSGKTYVRNPAFWLRGLNGLTGTHVGDGPGATAITPWHILEANHYKHDVGSEVCFADLDGKIVTRTVVATREIRPDIKSDILLGVLDRALPPSIVPLPLMPDNWTNHLPAARLPVAAMNQGGCFGLAILASLRQPVAGWFLHGYAYRVTPLVPGLQFEPLRGGDSGHPVVTLVGTNLVLLGHITSEAGATSLAGPDYSLYAADIAAAIRLLGDNETAKAQAPAIVELGRFR
jgi:hypothetical protein